MLTVFVIGVKWIWSIGGATWWREANVRELGAVWYLTPLRTVGKTEPHVRVQGAPMWSLLPYTGLGMSNISIVVNMTKRHSPCGWYSGMFAFSFLSWDSDSAWIEYVRTSGQWWENTFDDGRQYSPKGMRSPMLFTCSESTNCNWKPCQPKKMADASWGTCDFAMIYLDNDDQILTRWQ